MEQTDDYHGHPSYLKVWLLLLEFFAASLVAGIFFGVQGTVVAIFVVALIKAILVMGNFMHLRWEPKLLTALIVFAVSIAAIFFLGVYPDIVPIKLTIAK